MEVVVSDLVSAGQAKDEVREQLRRILSNSRFASAERNSKFLEFVVEKTLAGEESEIKEVVIAAEIYGRSAAYDPKVDSVVRVEASRLRAKLQRYYESEGAQDPIRITIPKGSYVAHFEIASPAEEVRPPEEARPAEQVFPANITEDMRPAAVEPPRNTRAFYVMVTLTLLGFGGVYLRSASDAPQAESLMAWNEGNELLRQDPNSALPDRGMPATIGRALERYELAVSKDPSFANGWASLAEAYDYAAPYVGRDRAEDTRRAEAAARRAVSLKPEMAYGHAILGLVLFCLRWDFAGAEREYRRAIELDPRSTYAIVEFVDLLRETARTDEAETVIRKARALQPAIPVLAVKEAELDLDRGRPDSAIATMNSALQISQNFGRAHVVLGMAWESKGEYSRALESYRTALTMNRYDRRALPALGYLLARLGRRDEALNVARELESLHARFRGAGFQVAVVYEGLNEHGKALDWLERAYRAKQEHVPFMAVEHRFAGLRKEPRFQAILKSLKLPLPN